MSNDVLSVTGDLLIYPDSRGEGGIRVLLVGEKVWLTQRQMAELFDVSIKTVNEHLQNVYDEDEPEPERTIRKFRTVQTEGGRDVRRQRFLALLDDEGRLTTTDRLQCVFASGRYAWDWQYNGFITLPKHFFPQIGNLKAQGEEFECANFIANTLEGVKDWVRNVERKPGAFSLPTSRYRFYPDFLVRMADGRMLVVEYKGADRYDQPEQVEKRRIGELWARRAGDRYRFVMPKQKDWTMIRAALE